MHEPANSRCFHLGSVWPLLLVPVLFPVGLAGSAPLETGEQAAAVSDPEQRVCTYSSYDWSMERRGPVNRRQVRKSYADLEEDERDPDEPGCTVCRQDQVEIDLQELGFARVGSVTVCRVFAERLVLALRQVAAAGDFEIGQIQGYRVGRTRGPVKDGVRTVLSNHSYGTAIDINRSHNGLYTRCSIDKVTRRALRSCRLSMGGSWNPSRFPRRTVVPGGTLHTALTQVLGWRWGGEISGKIRDLMHFSLTGY
jgi:hypothetical protein